MLAGIHSATRRAATAIAPNPTVLRPLPTPALALAVVARRGAPHAHAHAPPRGDVTTGAARETTDPRADQAKCNGGFECLHGLLCEYWISVCGGFR